MKTTKLEAQDPTTVCADDFIAMASEKLAEGLDALNARADELPEIGNRMLTNAKQMLSDASQRTRAQPKMAVGIAVVAGLLLARWIFRPLR